MDYSYAMPIDKHRSHTAVASGYLFKVSHEGTPFARWHRRYYVLYSDGLLYSFKNARSRASNRVVPIGRMCLRMKFGEDTTLEDCNSWPKGVPQQLCFSIINSDRSYHFFCESEREFETWRQHLLGTLDKLASHWSIDIGASARVEVAVSDTTFNRNATLYATDPGDQVENDVLRKAKEADIQIEVESVDDEHEQLPYDKIGPANVGGHVDVRSDRVESEGDEEHTKHRLTVDSDSEGSLANESTAVNVSEENLAALEPSGEEVSEEEETDKESEQTLQEDTSTTIQEADRTTSLGVKGEEGMDHNQPELANHEEQLLAESIQIVDPEVQEFLAGELESEALSLHTQEYAVKPDALNLEFQKVEDLIESVFNEMTSPPASHSPGKQKLRESEQERLVGTTQTGKRKSAEDMGLYQQALTSLSGQRAHVKEAMTRVGPASDFWTVHGTSSKNERVNKYSHMQPRPIKKEVHKWKNQTFVLQ